MKKIQIQSTLLLIAIALMGDLKAMSPTMERLVQEREMAKKWEETEEPRRYGLPPRDEEAEEAFEQYRAEQKQRVDSIYEQLGLARGWEEEKQTAPTTAMLMSLGLDDDTIVRIIKAWRNEGHLFPDTKFNPLAVANAIGRYAAFKGYINHSDAIGVASPEEEFSIKDFEGRRTEESTESKIYSWPQEYRDGLLSNLAAYPTLAQEPDLEVAQNLIRWGADANAQDKWGNPVLTVAAQNNHTNLVETLLLAGANVDAKNINDIAALMYAAREDNLAMVRVLLTFNAEVNVSDTNGQSPLFYAVFSNNLEMVNALLDAGVHAQSQSRYGVTALSLAENHGHTEIARVLREHELNN